MSFWDNVRRLTQPYSDDSDYDDEDDDVMEEENELPFEETPPAARTASRSGRRTPAFSVPSEPDTTSNVTGFSGQVVSMGNKQEVVLFHPANFNDTSKASDDLRSRKAVIVNMENVDKAMARRVVDFLSGCAYALDGKVKKVAQSTYLFCPHNMEVIGDLESLQNEAESYI